MAHLAPLVPAAICAGLAHTVFRDFAARQRVTRNPLWKWQFLCHPLIVGAFLYLGLPPLLLAPFVFNFGIEPWDLPRDPLFYACFYAHHLGPLLAAISLDGAGRARGGEALLFAHVWLLHPLGAMDHKKQIDKQRWFWPYMAEGFVAQLVWWRGVLEAAGAPASLPALCGPVALQYAGRWGLYARLLSLFPQIRGTDAFEERKLRVEAAAFVASLALACWARGWP